jgi:methyl-accepting chemotaxis protein
MYMTETREPFNRRIQREGMKPNLCAALLIFIYAAFFISLKLRQLPWALLVVAVIVAFAEFVFSPLTNSILTKKLSGRIAAWQNGTAYDYGDRTALFEDIMEFPVKKSFQTFAYFFICATLMALGYHFVPAMEIDWKTDAMSYAACLFGSYNAGLLTLAYSERVCSDYTEELVRQGIDDKYVQKKKQFGLHLNFRCVLYLILPVFFTAVLTFLVLLQGYGSVNGYVLTPFIQIGRMSGICIINMSICCVLGYLFYRQIKASTGRLGSMLTEVLVKESSEIFVPTNVCDRMQYNIYLLNGIISQFHELLLKNAHVGDTVRKNSADLSEVTGNFSSTSLEQSAGVKEIVATMEDSGALSRNISARISNVASGAEQTTEDVASGVDILLRNVSQLQELNRSNTEISDGIRLLSTQIDSVRDIVNSINEIADQTRIIAFNAELEAVRAGVAGRNFHIVASEIRRLADSTMRSTQEIRQRITDVQNASRDLVAVSGNGTACIADGMHMARELDSRFNDIKASADITSGKSAEIARIIEQQTEAFSQIVITLRQISTGIDNFTDSTRMINTAAAEMEKQAERLSGLQHETDIPEPVLKSTTSRGAGN